mmetsp:Transcript_84884/g.248823  ORF Transcript_84884/g.248823 Transcript_84884/m.248823 type:complete len:612 (-) Transcript_84884:1010-2845(-)
MAPEGDVVDAVQRRAYHETPEGDLAQDRVKENHGAETAPGRPVDGEAPEASVPERDLRGPEEHREDPGKAHKQQAAAARQEVRPMPHDVPQHGSLQDLHDDGASHPEEGALAAALVGEKHAGRPEGEVAVVDQFQVPGQLLHGAPLVVPRLHVSVSERRDQVIADEGRDRDGRLGAKVVGQGLDVTLRVLADAVRQPEVDFLREADGHGVVRLRVVRPRQLVEDVLVAAGDLEGLDEQARLVEVPVRVQGPVVDQAPAVGHLVVRGLHMGQVQLAQDGVRVHDGEHDLEGREAPLLHVPPVDRPHREVHVGVLPHALAGLQSVLRHEEVLHVLPAELPQHLARLSALRVPRLRGDDEHRPPRDVGLAGYGGHRAREDLQRLLVLHDHADVEKGLGALRERSRRPQASPEALEVVDALERLVAAPGQHQGHQEPQGQVLNQLQRPPAAHHEEEVGQRAGDQQREDRQRELRERLALLHCRQPCALLEVPLVAHRGPPSVEQLLGRRAGLGGGGLAGRPGRGGGAGGAGLQRVLPALRRWPPWPPQALRSRAALAAVAGGVGPADRGGRLLEEALQPSWVEAPGKERTPDAAGEESHDEHADRRVQPQHCSVP